MAYINKYWHLVLQKHSLFIYRTAECLKKLCWDRWLLGKAKLHTEGWSWNSLLGRPISIIIFLHVCKCAHIVCVCGNLCQNSSRTLTDVWNTKNSHLSFCADGGILNGLSAYNKGRSSVLPVAMMMMVLVYLMVTIIQIHADSTVMVIIFTWPYSDVICWQVTKELARAINLKAVPAPHNCLLVFVALMEKITVSSPSYLCIK